MMKISTRPREENLLVSLLPIRGCLDSFRSLLPSRAFNCCEVK